MSNRLENRLVQRTFETDSILDERGGSSDGLVGGNKSRKKKRYQIDSFKVSCKQLKLYIMCSGNQTNQIIVRDLDLELIYLQFQSDQNRWALLLIKLQNLYPTDEWLTKCQTGQLFILDHLHCFRVIATEYSSFFTKKVHFVKCRCYCIILFHIYFLKSLLSNATSIFYCLTGKLVINIFSCSFFYTYICVLFNDIVVAKVIKIECF